jgi:RimJ/RimL family protein N-acetyltransferase
MAHSLTTGQQVAIRPWRRRDRRELQRWPASPIPPHWMAADPTTGERLSFAVDHIGQEVLIGRVSLRDITAIDARIGIYLHPYYTSRGFGSEALAIFTGYALDTLRIAALRADIAIDNITSIQCFKKCGYRLVSFRQRDGFVYCEMERRDGASGVVVRGGAAVQSALA